MEATLTLPDPTPSLNRTLRTHWSRVRRDWRVVGWQLRAAICEVGRRNLPMGCRVRVIITRYGGRLIDYDNLVGGSKGLIDLLVRERLLVDDSPEWVTVRYEQAVDRADTRTEITLRW